MFITYEQAYQYPSAWFYKKDQQLSSKLASGEQEALYQAYLCFSSGQICT